jgi:MFS family permease
MTNPEHNTTTKVASQVSPRTNAATLLLAVICASIFFDALDLSITQIALPQIQEALRVPTSTLPWIATAYVLTYGGFLLLGGRAGDLIGARKVFITGLAIFGVSSLVCGLAGDSTLLIAARAVQGTGAALTVPTAVALLASAFPEGPARNRGFAAFTAAAASGFTGGLILGGLITSGLSWRWIFLAKVPIVALALLVAVLATPITPTASRRRGYDLAGAVTVTVGAVLLLYGITRIGDPAAGSVVIVVPLAGAAVALAAFVVVERRSRAPLLALRLLRLRSLVAADAAALTVLAAPFGVSYLVSLYLQDVLHRNPWQTAVTLMPGSVLSAIVGRYAAPWALDRFGLRRVYATALLLVATGDALLIGLDAHRATWLVVTAALVAFGLGMGLAYPAATVGGIQGVGPADQGTAAGLNNTALQIGGGLGLAAVAATVAVGLHGDTPAAVTAGMALHAVRLGAVTVTFLPIVGAVIAIGGLRTPTRRNSAPAPTDE